MEKASVGDLRQMCRCGGPKTWRKGMGGHESKVEELWRQISPLSKFLLRKEERIRVYSLLRHGSCFHQLEVIFLWESKFQMSYLIIGHTSNFCLDNRVTNLLVQLHDRLNRIWRSIWEPFYHSANSCLFVCLFVFMRERGRGAEGDAGSMQEAWHGTPSRVSRFRPWAESGTKPLSHPGCPNSFYSKIFYSLYLSPLSFHFLLSKPQHFSGPWQRQPQGLCTDSSLARVFTYLLSLLLNHYMANLYSSLGKSLLISSIPLQPQRNRLISTVINIFLCSIY